MNELMQERRLKPAVVLIATAYFPAVGGGFENRKVCFGPNGERPLIDFLTGNQVYRDIHFEYRDPNILSADYPKATKEQILADLSIPKYIKKLLIGLDKPSL